jgi:AraC-like DNA-binding protein
MPTNDKAEIPPPDREQSRALARARRAEKAERRETMFDLVVSGYQREQIAQKLGVSVATVRREVDRAIGQRRLDAPDRYVRLQVMRLNKAQLVVDHALEHGDIRAVGPLVRLAGALDRYHGLAVGATARNDVEPRRLGRAATPLALTHAGSARERGETAAPEVAEKGASSALKSFDAEMKSSPRAAASRSPASRRPLRRSPEIWRRAPSPPRPPPSRPRSISLPCSSDRSPRRPR